MKTIQLVLIGSIMVLCLTSGLFIGTRMRTITIREYIEPGCPEILCSPVTCTFSEKESCDWIYEDCDNG